MGEVSALVFTAGVGENSATVRSRVLAKLGPMGYQLDLEKNQKAVGLQMDISKNESPIRILVIPTNEELLIAQDTYAC